MTTTIEPIDALLRVLSVDQTADLLGLTPRTLANMRRRHAGPKVTVLSTGRIGYRVRDIAEWLDGQAESREAVQ